MMPFRQFLFPILLFVVSFSIAQRPVAIEEDGFVFRHIKTKKNSRKFEWVMREKVVPSKGHEKFQFRFLVNSITQEENKFDSNKFYLLSKKYKVRLRPSEIKYSFISVPWLSNKKSLDIRSNTKYKPKIIDTFWDYKKEGYQDIVSRINVGTKKNPLIITPYYDQIAFKKETLNVYFIVPKGFDSGDVYYGEKKIAELRL